MARATKADFSTKNSIAQLELEIFPFQCHHNLILSAEVRIKAVDCRLGSSSTQQNDKKVSLHIFKNQQLLMMSYWLPIPLNSTHPYEHEPIALLLVNSLESTCFATACTLYSNCLKSLSILQGDIKSSGSYLNYITKMTKGKMD